VRQRRITCTACLEQDHNRRTCARRKAKDQLRMFDDSAPPPPAPEDLGPWQQCVAGDPFCPCVRGVGHVEAA
jgi:hypothetical protein